MLIALSTIRLSKKTTNTTTTNNNTATTLTMTMGTGCAIPSSNGSNRDNEKNSSGGGILPSPTTTRSRTMLFSRSALLLLSVALLRGSTTTATAAFVVVPQQRRPPTPSFVPVVGGNSGGGISSSSSSSAATGLRLSTPSEIIFIIEDDGDGDDEYEEEEEEEDDDDDTPEDPYVQIAKSEFLDQQSNGGGSIVPTQGAGAGPTTALDWGGALGKLRQRVEDAETGKSQDPSHALFRLLSAKSPSQQIASFVSSASPGVVQAMGGAVGSLLGGLSSPGTGVDVVVKANAEKMGSLCFQLQMTGYMFRNAEYVIALKEIMKIRGTATLDDYRDAFDELDADGSGYIDRDEIRDLLDDVYEGKVPAFEVEAFLKFFDSNNDGKISWDEFERGLGSAMAQQNGGEAARLRLLTGGSGGFGGDDGDEPEPDVDEPEISGMIEVELEDGKVVEVEAKEYMENLKREARDLKAALRRELLGDDVEDRTDFLPGLGSAQQRPQQPGGPDFGGITEYISKRQGDIKALTEGISPEIVETMKLLVDFVMDGGDSGKAPPDKKPEELEMELPASALQQLALWQLVLGYKLREAEAKGDYLKLLE